MVQRGARGRSVRLQQRQPRVLGPLRVGRAAVQDVLNPPRAEVGPLELENPRRWSWNSLRIPRRIVQVFTAICYRRRRSFRERIVLGGGPQLTGIENLPARFIAFLGFGLLCILAGPVALYCSFCAGSFSRGLLFLHVIPSFGPREDREARVWADLHSSRTCASCCASGKATRNIYVFETPDFSMLESKRSFSV